jgi:hypothetical protein
VPPSALRPLVVAVTASLLGAVLLVLVGVAFLAASLTQWWRLDEDPSSRRRRVLGCVIDLLVGGAAITDGALSVLDHPARVAVWSAGSAVLVIAVALLVHRHRIEGAAGRQHAGVS